MTVFEITINTTKYRVHKARYQNRDNGIQVREAHDLHNDVEVAVKFLPWPSSKSKAVKFHKFLMDEINAMKQLRQVNGDFVQLLNYQEKLHHNNTDWAVIVMPLYWGSLKALNLKKLADDAKESLNLLNRLAIAVQTMHKRKVIHRDLKLANVCIDRHFNPYIVDFGHAILCSPDKMLEEYPIGTRGCRCPEYVKNYGLIKSGKKPENKEYHAERFDVFSLGVIFFQVLAGGSHPFTRAELTDDRYKFLAAQDSKTFWEVQDTKCKRKVPEDARSLIEGMLCANPAERFTMQQVLDNSYFADEDTDEFQIFIEVPKPQFGGSNSASNRSSEGLSSTSNTSPFPSAQASKRSLRPSLGNSTSSNKPSLKPTLSNSKSSKASLGSRFLSFVGMKNEKRMPKNQEPVAFE